VGASKIRSDRVAGRLFAAALFCLFFAGALTSPHASAAETLKGVALVIGNGDYERLPKLSNPENDADGVENLLDKLGFDTTATADRDARRLRRDLEGFAEDAEGADVAVLYYSGHGIEAGGRNYLVPVDADLSSLDDAGENLVAVDTLIDKLKLEVPIVIVMLDACRNNPFPPDAMVRLEPGGEALPIAVSGLGGSRSAVSFSPTPTSGQSSADVNVGAVLAFAAEPGKVALDGEPGANSPYAAALLRHLSAMAGDEFGMVMRMVAEEVYLKTKGQQRPWVSESMRRLLYLGKTPDQPTGAEGDILTERRGLLVTIAALPDRERRTIETVASDTGVPMDALYGMLKALGSEVPEDPAQLDALLRGQTEKVKAMIAERDTLKSSDAEIMRLSGLADQALAEGALNAAINLRQQAKARAKEVEATVDDAESQVKKRRIELAEVYAKSAEAYALAFKHREAALDYEEAARQVEKWDEEQTFWYTRSAATAYLEAGKLRGGAADLERAVELGKRAAAIIDRMLLDEPDRREYWQDTSAQTLNNLANASGSLYFTTKQRRFLMESIDAYERALKVLSRERVPLDWVIVQFNLAGNFMMLGEGGVNPDQLRQAIEAQEAVQTVWTRQDHPVRWAMSMTEIGRAKSILGETQQNRQLIDEAILSFQRSLEVLTEAETPLDWALTQDSLADAYSQRAVLSKDQEDARKSLAASQEALKVYTLDKTPRLWARTMHDMAVHIVENSPPEKQRNNLLKALAVYEQIIAALDPDSQLNEYGLSAGNAALTQIDIGMIDKDAARVEGAIADLRGLVGLYARHDRKLDAAKQAVSAAESLTKLGKMRERADEYEEALDAFQQAAQMFREADATDQADKIPARLAYAYGEIGYRKLLAGDIAGGVAARQAALNLIDRIKSPADWRFATVQLAVALQRAGENETGVDSLRKAAGMFDTVLSANEISVSREELAKNRQSLVNIRLKLAERSGSSADYLALAEAYGAQVADRDKAREREGRDSAEANRGWALSIAGELASDRATLEKAIAALTELLKRTDITDTDRIFSVRELQRAHFLAGNLSEDSAHYRSAIALTDAEWPLIQRAAEAEQQINLLLDKANLMAMVSSKQPDAFSTKEIEATYRSAIDLTDPKAGLGAWRNAQKQFAAYLLNGVDQPDFPEARMQSGLQSLRAALDATPKQEEPGAWAEMANWYGYALGLRGKRENRIESFNEALPFLREAVATFATREDELSAAHTRDSLCVALTGLGRMEKRGDLLAEAIDNCSQSVAYMQTNKIEDVLPIARTNLADAQKALAELNQ
jgi:uncharacterized caspase-like protein